MLFSEEEELDGECLYIVPAPVVRSENGESRGCEKSTARPWIEPLRLRW